MNVGKYLSGESQMSTAARTAARTAAGGDWPCKPDASCNCMNVCVFHPSRRPAEPLYYWKAPDGTFHTADPQPSLYAASAPIAKATSAHIAQRGAHE